MEIQILYPDVWIEISYWLEKRHLLILKTMITVILQAILVTKLLRPAVNYFSL